MNATHPTGEQLERYRRRAAAPDELLAIDAHIASCDRCHALVRETAAPVALPREHLSFEEMAAWVDGSADELASEHLASCERCRAEVGDLEKVRDSMADDERQPLTRRFASALSRSRERVAPQEPGEGRTKRWLLAAMLTIALLATLFLLRDDNPSQAPVAIKKNTTPAPRPQPQPIRVVTLTKPPILDTLVREPVVLRSEDDERPLALRAPIATVVLDDRPQFAWEPAPQAKTYNVAVADALTATVEATGESRTTTWRPDKPLPRGRTYIWQVSTRRSAGDTTRGEALFHVASDADVAAVNRVTGYERGIALAQRGILDEAERELSAAADPRAKTALDTVRAWRVQRATPTTTNGAQ